MSFFLVGLLKVRLCGTLEIPLYVYKQLTLCFIISPLYLTIYSHISRVGLNEQNALIKVDFSIVT